MRLLALAVLTGCGGDRLVGTWQGSTDCEEVPGVLTEEAFELVLDEVAVAPEGDRRFGTLVRDIVSPGSTSTTTYGVEAPVEASPGETLVLRLTCLTLDADPPFDPALEAQLCDRSGDDLRIEWLAGGDMELDVFDDGSCVVSMERI